MEKMFKGYGVCPYTGNTVDSPQCRQCKWFAMSGTLTFIWCSHPVDERAKEKAENHITVTKKTATRTPTKPKQRGKGNSAQIKKAKSTPKQETGKRKRGRPKKNA